jgi:hypothetical protein
MAILSFKPRFADKVQSGEKQQTIRQYRKYPVLPMEQLYLYTGLRTIHTRKLGEGQCTGTNKITLNHHAVIIHHMRPVFIEKPAQLDRFARYDGFPSWKELREFWLTEHGDDCFPFHGTIIYWTLLPKKSWGKQTAAQRKKLKEQYA